jgi:cytoskeletal protein CcmA (bactofilin family)
MRTSKRVVLFVGLLLMAALVVRVASPVQAYTPREGDKVVIGKGEVIDDDLYVTANEIVLQGTVRGDLVAFGSVITIDPGASVEGSFMGVAQGITINGSVKDNVRVAGMSIQVGESAKIGHDLVMAGYNVEVLPGASVGGDVVAAGSQVALDGTIKGDAKVYANGLQLTASVGGDVDAKVGEPGQSTPFSPTAFMPQRPGMPPVAPPFSGLTIGDKAKIGGNLTYQTTNEIKLPTGVIAGSTTHTTPPPETQQTLVKQPPSPLMQVVNWFFGLLRQTATLLVVGLLLVWLAPGLLRRGADVVKGQPLPSLLWGVVGVAAFVFALFLLVVVVVMLAIVFGLITLGDLLGVIVSLGFLVGSALILGFRIAASYLSKILVGFLVGRLIIGLFKPEQEHPFWSVIVGVVIFAFLASIPFLGWLINLIVVLIGLGALWLLAREWLNQRKTGAAVAAV